MDAKELGRRVRAARAYAGLSNTELAESIQIGRSTLVKIEAGRREAKRWELYAIAEVCGVPREWFDSETPLPLSADAIDEAQSEQVERELAAGPVPPGESEEDHQSTAERGSRQASG